MDRVTVEQDARILGIKEESVRKRVSRGSSVLIKTLTVGSSSTWTVPRQSVTSTRTSLTLSHR